MLIPVISLVFVIGSQRMSDLVSHVCRFIKKTIDVAVAKRHMIAIAKPNRSLCLGVGGDPDLKSRGICRFFDIDVFCVDSIVCSSFQPSLKTLSSFDLELSSFHLYFNLWSGHTLLPGALSAGLTVNHLLESSGSPSKEGAARIPGRMGKAVTEATKTLLSDMM